MARWFNIPAPESQVRGNPQEMAKWIILLTKTAPHRRFFMKSSIMAAASNGVLSGTVLRAISNGHSNAEMWFYVNNILRDRDGKRFFLVPDPKPHNWVMDLDNVPGIRGKTSEARIQSLIKKIKEKNCPIPFLITETSPCSFHLLYMGSGKEWCREARLGLAMKLAGINRHGPKLKEELKKAGIDIGYLNQNVGMSKMRLPGSINLKKYNLFGGKAHVVHGWVNDSYALATECVIGDLRRIGQKAPKPQAPKEKKKSDRPWAWLVRDIKIAIRPFVSENQVDKVATFLAQNQNLLLQNNCRILQTYAAQEIGIPQYAVSRLLKQLINSSALVCIRSYIQGRCAKTYGAGPLLHKAFEAAKKRSEMSIGSPYKDGAFNEHYLRDIRFLISRGWGDSQIAEFIYRKQEQRNQPKKLRSKKEILSAISLWRKKAANSITNAS